jgi:diguanylate cyclase (GGDEF)-like protein
VREEVESITVLLATDSFLIGEGLISLLANHSEVTVTGWARNQHELIRLTDKLDPQALIITIRTPLISTLATITSARILRERHPNLLIVIVSDHANGFAVELLRGGASRVALLLDDKLPSLETVLEALRSLSLGQSVLDPSIVDSMVSRGDATAEERFTIREVDVLEQMAHGLSNRAVAAELHVALKTVEKQVTIIFRKLGLSDQTLVDRRVTAALIYLRNQSDPFAPTFDKDIDLRIVVPWDADEMLVHAGNHPNEALLGGPPKMTTTPDRQLSDVLSDFARTMLTDFPIQGILDQLVRRIVEILPITGAGVTLISESTSPHYVAASDDAALRFEELQTVFDEGPCILAYRTGEAVVIADLSKDGRFPHFSPQALEAGLAAAFTFPLRHGNSQLGALDLYRDTPGSLNNDSMVIAQTLADVTSAYLVNAQARSDLVHTATHAQSSALHDPLTGLPNRTLLLERIQHALLSRRRSGKLVAVLFIDLDGFKKINDTSGHQVGDDLLVAVSIRLTNLLRPGDTLARLSGDEFVIVCGDLDEEGQVEGLATRLDAAISTPFDLSGLDVKLAASIGIAFAGQGNDPEGLLHKADVAMYQAKRKGGANHHVIDEDEYSVTESRDTLQQDLGHVVERNELRLEYQPVVRVIDGRVTCLEALVRWNHPERGVISPSVMIPLAEQSGNIVAIGQWVLENACVDRHRWEMRTGDEALVVAVNVSANQLMAPGFVTLVRNILTLTRTDAKNICLEITESALVQDGARAFDVLSQLKTLGIRLALDDFGTGYSSLSYLVEFPFDIVKIDQSSIAKLMENKASHATVAKTIELAHLLDLTVVCEGVETAEQDREVAVLTSDFSQGFYLSRPMTAERVDEMTSNDKSSWTISFSL